VSLGFEKDWVLDNYELREKFKTPLLIVKMEPQRPFDSIIL